MNKTIIYAAASALALSLGAAPSFAADAKKQEEVRKATAATLDKFYKAKPAIKDEVQKAPGYGVFTTYGVSFLLGGAGGTGVVHDAKAKKDTYMHMAQASAGPQVGIAQNDLLIVFKDEKALKSFVDKGWEVGGGGAISAGAGGKTAGGGSGEEFVSDAQVYKLTRNGVEAGGLVSGTKFWKEKELN